MKNSPTKMVVGLAAMVGLLAGLWLLLPPFWFGVATLALVYEFWTVFNKYPHDTISDIVWLYRKRTIIPLMVGIAIGASVAAGVLGDPLTAARGLAIGGLAAHFFFPPEKDEEERV